MQNNYMNPTGMMLDPNQVSQILGPVQAGATLADNSKVNDYLMNDYARNRSMDYFLRNQEMPSTLSGLALKNAQNQYALQPGNVERSYQAGIGPGMNAYQGSELTRQTMPGQVAATNAQNQMTVDTAESGTEAKNAGNKETTGQANEAQKLRGYRNFVTDAELFLNQPMPSNPTVGQLEENVQGWYNLVEKALKNGYISSQEVGPLKMSYSPETKQQMRAVISTLKDRTDSYAQSNKLEQIRATGREQIEAENLKGQYDLLKQQINSAYQAMISQGQIDNAKTVQGEFVKLMRAYDEVYAKGDLKQAKQILDRAQTFANIIVASSASRMATGAIPSIGMDAGQLGQAAGQAAPQIPNQGLQPGLIGPSSGMSGGASMAPRQNSPMYTPGTVPNLLHPQQPQVPQPTGVPPQQGVPNTPRQEEPNALNLQPPQGSIANINQMPPNPGVMGGGAPMPVAPQAAPVQPNLQGQRQGGVSGISRQLENARAEHGRAIREKFKADIIGVTPEGYLVIQDKSGKQSKIKVE